MFDVHDQLLVVGDFVRVVAYGSSTGARLSDVGRVGRVDDLARTRVVVEFWQPGQGFAVRNLSPKVLRRTDADATFVEAKRLARQGRLSVNHGLT